MFKRKEECVVVIENNKIPFVDEMMLRFPHILKDIFEELDNESLASCRKVSQSWCNFIDNSKYYWIRHIKKCVNKHTFWKQWNQVLKKLPTKDTKELSEMVRQSCVKNKHHLCSPMAIAVEQGHIDFCKYMIKKTNNSEVTFSNGRTLEEFFYFGSSQDCIYSNLFNL